MGFTSFGIKNPWKKYLTKAQMFQFSILIVHSFVCLAFETKITKPLCFLQTCYQFTMLGLFMNFYNKSYKGKKAKAKEIDERCISTVFRLCEQVHTETLFFG